MRRDLRAGEPILDEEVRGNVGSAEDQVAHQYQSESDGQKEGHRAEPHQQQRVLFLSESRPPLQYNNKNESWGKPLLESVSGRE
jgi:hypothetical protein